MTEVSGSTVALGMPARLRGAILREHAAAFTAGQPGYLGPGTGLFVLAASFPRRSRLLLRARLGHCRYVE